MLKRVREVVNVGKLIPLTFDRFVDQCIREKYEFTRDIEKLKALIARICKFQFNEVATTKAGNFMNFKIYLDHDQYTFSVQEMNIGYLVNKACNFQYVFKRLFEAFAPCFEGVAQVDIEKDKILSGDQLLYAIQQEVKIPNTWKIYIWGPHGRENVYTYKKGVRSLANMLSRYKRRDEVQFDSVVVAER